MDWPKRTNIISRLFQIVLIAVIFCPVASFAQTVNSRTFSGGGTSITATGSSLNTNLTNASIAVTGTVAISGTVAATQSGTWTVQPGNTANTTPWLATITQGGNAATVSAGGALKVDGSAATQPVSGTVTVTDGAGALNVIVDSGTTTVTQGTATNLNAAVVGTGTAGSPAGNILTVQGVSAMTKLLVTPDSVALPANQTVNVTQFGSTNVVTGTGASAAGVPRVTVSNDSNILASQSGTWNVTNVSGTVSLPTGASTLAEQQTQTTALQLIDNIVSGAGVNITQFGGTNVVTGTGVGGSGIPRVTVSSDSTVTANAGTGTFGVAGVKSNNAGVPGSTNIGILPAIANAAIPLWTEGNQVNLSTDLNGSQRVTVQDQYGRPVSATANSVAMQIGGLTSLLLPSNLQTGQLSIATIDNFGRLRSISGITDGQHVAALRGPEGPQPTDYGVVVSHSIVPELQCPFVATISVTANTQLVTNAGNQFLHVCTFSVVIAAAESISLVEGTGSTCGTATRGLYGGTAASAAFAANGGVAMVSDRIIVPMQVRGDHLCLLKSAANNASGTLVYGVY